MGSSARYQVVQLFVRQVTAGGFRKEFIRRLSLGLRSGIHRAQQIVGDVNIILARHSGLVFHYRARIPGRSQATLKSVTVLWCLSHSGYSDL
jgi:hypothetical protein